VVAALAFLAYIPTLSGTFLALDDTRFIVDNPAVHDLSPAKAASYFTDPGTLSVIGWRGTYRPLRTLDFALDWAVSGGRPWLFHLRNVLYHVLGSLLVLDILSRLAGGRPRVALAGALVFALHPANAECVAWITSRGDLLLLCLFLLALRWHLTGRHVLALLAAGLAMLAKESAIVFPAAALLTDLYRRLVLLWLRIIGGAGESLGHHAEWWGGTYGANLLTMARGLLHYAGLLALPVRQGLDYHVPTLTGLDAGAVAGLLLLAAIVVAAWRGGATVRFAAVWLGITILPTANLLFTVGIPTAERFLYLPMVGIALLAGHAVGRTRIGLCCVPLCLFALTMVRAADWRDVRTLFAANSEPTPRGLFYSAVHHLEDAYEVRHDGRALRAEVDAVIENANEYFRFYRERVGKEPSVNAGLVLVKKANALLLVHRDEEAVAAARAAVRYGGGALAHYNAGLALARLQRVEEAADAFLAAIGDGWDGVDLRPSAAQCLNHAGLAREQEGRRAEARALFKRSRDAFPDPARNAPAYEALRRLR
jgi:hypothetical protein